MPLRRTSVTFAVVVALVSVITLLMGGLGVARYHSERTQQLETLSREVSVSADQLATALTLPVWSVDRAETEKIIESTMADKNVEGIVATAGDATIIRTRDDRRQAVLSDGHFLTNGLLVEERAIVYSGRTIGQVKVFATQRFLEDGLRHTRDSIVLYIVVFDVALILSLYVLLWRLVLRPLREIEGYAVAVSGGDSVRAFKRSYLGSELENLRNSVSTMVLLLESRYADLRQSEQKFRNLFESSPVSFWEEDMSDVRGFLDELKKKGVVNLDDYLDENPDAIAECVRRVKVLDVNQATLRLHEARDKRELLEGIQKTFVPESLVAFRKGVLAIWNSQPGMTTDGVVRTLDGKPRQVIVQWSVASGFERTWARVLVCLSDITERKHAEESLRLSELNYREIFNATSEAILVHDASTGAILDVNARMLEMFGYPRSEIDTLEIGALSLGTPPYSPADAAIKVGMAVTSGPQRFEWRSRRKNGGLFWSEVSLRCSEVGGRHRVLAVVRDITERKRIEDEIRKSLDETEQARSALLNTLEDQKKVEDALRQSEERLRLALSAARMGSWEWNFVDNQVHWSEQVEQVLGLANGSFGRTYEAYMSLVHPDDRDELIRRIDKARAGGTPQYVTEHRIIWPDGSIHWIEGKGAIHRDAAGRAVRMTGTILNITERKRAGEALRESERQLSLIFNSTNDMMALSRVERGPVFRMVSVNRKYLEVVRAEGFELDSGDLVGRTIEEVTGTILHFGPKAAAESIARYTEALTTGHTVRFEAIRDTPRGRHFGETTLIPVKGDSGSCEYILFSLRDVSESRRAEEQIRKLNAELELRVEQRTEELSAVNRELESFSYSVSHDLRAPLRNVSGFVELLRKRAASLLDQQNTEYLATITGETKRMGRLIDDLLALSKLGRAEIHRAPVDMAVLFSEARDSLAIEMMGRDILWKVGSLPTVQADRDLMFQVLANLLGNAVKYTRPREQASIEIGCRPDPGGKEHVFFVRDDGVGFNMKYVDKLFGVFQRLHSARQFEGTGIGLANVQRIIHRHGGRVWAESELNAGATFFFSLPAGP